MMDDSFGGFLLALVMVLVFTFALAVGSAQGDNRADRAIICMEATSDAKLCRIQANLTVRD